MLTQHLGNRQYQVSGGDAFAQFAAELKAHNIGDQH